MSRGPKLLLLVVINSIYQQTRDDPFLVMCCNYFVASDSEDDSKTVEEFDGFIHCLRLKYKKENIVKAYTANNSMYPIVSTYYIH